jgi:hypothetical protein
MESWSSPPRPHKARSWSLTRAKMFRLTKTLGSRAWPASFQASRKARDLRRLLNVKRSPVSSFFSVEA